MIRPLLLTFIPLFVAVDVVAVVLVYLGIGMPLDETARRRLVLEATMTAAAIGLGFLLVGDAVLHFLGVTVGDFQVAGGVLLLVLSIYDLLHPELPLRQPGAHLGVVPLGIPMIVGPATLTTLLTPGSGASSRHSRSQGPSIMKIRRLLHPADFSSASGPAFKLALELARNRASLLLLHVLPPVPLVPDVYVAASVYERLRQAYEESARKRLDRLRRKAVAAGVRASALLRDSASAPEEIVRVARATRIDIIVMGTDGRGGIAKMFLGSVAERVVRTATRPVLTVRGR